MPFAVTHMNRSVMDAGQDLYTFMNRVYDTVMRNFSLFGGDDKWEVYPEEIHTSKVIVRNAKHGTYFIADLEDDETTITLSNVQAVKRQWVTVNEDGSERSDSEVFDSGPCAMLSNENRNFGPFSSP